MLHAALIGLPSTGKSTLFQLMTSAKDAPQGQGRHRGRHLEGARRRGSTGSPRCSTRRSGCRPRSSSPTSSRRAQPAPRRWSTSPATRTPTRWSTSCAPSATRRCRIRRGTIDPARDAQAMEDELILADLGVVERRLERLEKDLKKTKSPSSTRRRSCSSVQDGARERPAAARARPRRRRPPAAARLPVALGQAAAGRDQPRRGRRRRGRASVEPRPRPPA